jgi:hypothetical protein
LTPRLRRHGYSLIARPDTLDHIEYAEELGFDDI